MDIGYTVKKVLERNGEDLDHFLSAFPTHLLFRTKLVKGTTGNADGKTEYIGLAPADATLGQARWQIKKLVYDATGFQTDVLFADGDTKFDKVFDSGSSEYAAYTFTTT